MPDEIEERIIRIIGEAEANKYKIGLKTIYNRPNTAIENVLTVNLIKLNDILGLDIRRIFSFEFGHSKLAFKK